jgi:hypothetical protein
MAAEVSTSYTPGNNRSSVKSFSFNNNTGDSVTGIRMADEHNADGTISPIRPLQYDTLSVRYATPRSISEIDTSTNATPKRAYLAKSQRSTPQSTKLPLSHIQPKVRTYWLANEPAARVARFAESSNTSFIKSAQPAATIKVAVSMADWEACLLGLGFCKTSEASEVDGPKRSKLPLFAPVTLASSLPTICSVAFVGCSLTPAEILQLPVLPCVVEVDLSDNALTGIGESDSAEDAYWLAFAPKITKLFMRGCSLQKVPPLLAAPHLEDLDLSCNEIDEISEFDHCSMLRNVNLAYNNFKSVHSLRCLSLVINLRGLVVHPNPFTMSHGLNEAHAVLRNFMPFIHKIDDKAISRTRSKSAEPRAKLDKTPVRSSKKVLCVVDPQNDYVTAAFASVPVAAASPDISATMQSTSSASTNRATQMAKMRELASPVLRAEPSTEASPFPRWVGNQLVAPNKFACTLSGFTRRTARAQAAMLEESKNWMEDKQSTSTGSPADGTATEFSHGFAVGLREDDHNSKRPLTLNDINISQTSDRMFSKWITPPLLPEPIANPWVKAPPCASHTSDSPPHNNMDYDSTSSEASAWMRLTNTKTLAAISAIKKIFDVACSMPDSRKSVAIIYGVLSSLERVGIIVPILPAHDAITILRSPSEEDLATLASPRPTDAAPIFLESLLLCRIQHLSAIHAVSAVYQWATLNISQDESEKYLEILLGSLLVSPIGHLCAGFLHPRAPVDTEI